MIYFLAFLFLLILSEEPPESNPDDPETLPKYFRRIDDGPDLRKLVNHDGTGSYIRAVSVDGSRTDTLRIYVQGVVKGRVRPNRRMARKADIVVWCYPSKYGHPQHIFPDAEGRIYIQERNGKIAIATESFIEAVRNPTKLTTLSDEASSRQANDR